MHEAGSNLPDASVSADTSAICVHLQSPFRYAGYPDLSEIMSLRDVPNYCTTNHYPDRVILCDDDGPHGPPNPRARLWGVRESGKYY